MTSNIKLPIIRSHHTNTDKILSSMLRNAAFGIVLMELAGAITYIIDGIITSRFLGSTALAASGMTGICFTVLAVISGVLSAGMQQICCTEVGQGNVKRANQIFSTILLVTFMLSSGIALLGMLFSDGIATAIGASSSDAALHAYARGYITGFFLGATGHIFVAVLIPEVQLEGKNRQITFSILALAISDIIGNFLNVLVFHGGMLGMGIATSVSYYISALILFFTFISKDSLFKIRFTDLDFHVLPSVLNIGLPRATKRLGNILRPLVINRLILLAGGSIAMAAFTVEQNIRYMTESLGVGLSGAALLLISMFLGEKNFSSLKKISHITVYYIISFIGGLAVIYFIAAPFLARLYLNADSPSYLLAVAILRCHAVSLPFLGFNEFYISLVQGMGKLKTSHLVTLLNKLVYIVLLSLILQPLFGVMGLWVAIPLSEILLCLSILLVNGWRNRKNPEKASFFNLFDDTIFNPENELEITINSKDAVPAMLEQVQIFCKKHDLSEKTSYYVQLFFEELTLLIIDHGFANKKNPEINLRLYKDKDELILRSKDNCRPITAAEQQQMHELSLSSDQYIGIQMVFRLARKVDYINTMNINQFIIHI